MEESSLFVKLLLLLEKIQSFLSNQTKTNTSIRPVKITYVYQSAFLIAQKIFWKIRTKKNHFDKFVDLHFNKLKNANM
jgi:hypothetical protein